VCETSAVSQERQLFVKRCIDRDVLGLPVSEDDMRENVHRSMLQAMTAQQELDQCEQQQIAEREKMRHHNDPIVRKAVQAYVALKHLGLCSNMTQSEVLIKLKRSRRGRALLSFLSVGE
jgi:hypothetical protein